MPQAAVSLLLDCQCSILFSASDQGGGESYSGAVSFKADKVTVKESISSADHSTGQDTVENYRKGKISWEISVETKLYPQTGPSTYTLLQSLRANDLGKLIVTCTGAGVTGQGLIENVEVDYAGPSTLKFGIKAHGSPLQYA